MTGGNVVILGEIGDNFAAGMTGGMAFIYDYNNNLEKKINPETVLWQKVETNYWKKKLKNLIFKHFTETQSKICENIYKDFDNELNNFIQICPKEMLDRLENPINNKKITGVAS